MSRDICFTNDILGLPQPLFATTFLPMNYLIFVPQLFMHFQSACLYGFNYHSMFCYFTEYAFVGKVFDCNYST